MKRIFVIGFIVLGSLSAKSQEIGVRFGEVVGGNYAVDALLPLLRGNKLHVDVSFGNAVGLEALWDFIYRPLGKSLVIYGGIGPSAVFDDNSDPLFGLSGEAGLGYKFNAIPISLSADWRPTWWFVGDSEFQGGGFGVNLRYVFGKN